MWEKGDAWAEREKSTMLKQAGPLGGGEKKRGKREKKEKEKTGPDRWARETRPGKEEGKEQREGGGREA